MAEPAEHAEHVPSRRNYFVVFIALIVGTALTYFAATLDLGAFNDVVALVIAFTKATLVVLFFMHVYHSSRLTKLTVVAGLLWLAIMIFITLSDYLTRGWLNTYGAR